MSTLTWLFVLAADGGGKSGNHAVLYIEGINSDHHYFKHFVEFTGHRILSESCLEFEYVERTEAFMVPSEKAQYFLEMIERIQKPGFCIRGNDAIGSKGKHNCFTWLRSVLKLVDIDLGKSLFSPIITATKSFTQPEEYYQKDP
ncbi:MAG: hypothetical protein HWD61_07865 [Parachlamydiaceae bacterium]|nr:MAG: hypothetical protein HWD61_07865 [Parachlamydiaceae bacterium]